MIDLRKGDLESRNEVFERSRSVVQWKGQDNSDMLVYIVGFTYGAEERAISFEEANAWAQRHGCAYYEVNFGTGQNVVEVFMEMANDVREREPQVAKKVKDAYCKELKDAFLLRP